MTLCIVGLLFFAGVPGVWANAAQLRMVSAEEEDRPVLFLDHGVERRVRALLTRAELNYPLENGLTFLVFKEEKRLELWGHGSTGPRLVKEYPVMAMSGHAGPKLRRGDRQVPEGVYQVVWLNPNSEFHLSLKLDYPNTFDLHMAERDGRADPGGDIFIHGGAASQGCVAIGDAAIEELFVLTLMAGNGPIEVIIAPYDFRKRPERRPVRQEDPPWLLELYEEIKSSLARYPTPWPPT